MTKTHTVSEPATSYCSRRSSCPLSPVYDKLTTAASVRLGRVEAKQVPVAIQTKDLGPVDGLLGRSFLSHFDVVMTSRRWTLKPKL